MYSQKYLQAYVCKRRDSRDDLRQYVRQYLAITNVLVKKKVIDDYTYRSQFLERILNKVQKKLVKKFQVKEEELRTLNFKKLKKEAYIIYKTDILTKKFSYNKAKQDILSKLVDYNRASSIEVIRKELQYILPIILASRLKEDPNIDRITKVFKAIVLNLYIETKRGFNLTIKRNQNQSLRVGTLRRPVRINLTNLRNSKLRSLTYLEETKSCYYY